MHPGARQYQQAGERAAVPRTTEIAMFRDCNRRLSAASALAESDPAEWVAALHRNHRMWSALLKDIGLSSNPLPPILKQDLVTVGSFAMHYSTLAILQNLPVAPLIDLNDEMIEGLSQQAIVPPPPAAPRPVGGLVPQTA